MDSSAMGPGQGLVSTEGLKLRVCCGFNRNKHNIYKLSNTYICNNIKPLCPGTPTERCGIIFTKRSNGWGGAYCGGLYYVLQNI